MIAKKDLILLAQALAGAKPMPHASEPSNRYAGFYEAWRLCVSNVADACAQGNPNFKRRVFLKACGVEE